MVYSWRYSICTPVVVSSLNIIKGMYDVQRTKHRVESHYVVYGNSREGCAVMGGICWGASTASTRVELEVVYRRITMVFLVPR